MKIKLKAFFILILLVGILSACQPAVIESWIRETDMNARMITRCEEVDMRDNAQMQALFKKYDGWRVIYISEYTTGNRIGTDAAVCFEKPVQ